MMVVRPVAASDLDSLFDLAENAGSGLTTLPPSRDLLSERIAKSVESFAKQVTEPGDEYYFLVLEDTEAGKVVGTSGIFATVGLTQPFYSYRIMKLTQVSQTPEMRVDIELLQLVNDYAGNSELATLYLHPDYRKDGNGRLLARARYLFIAAYPERFSDQIMAEIRGWVDENGESPFWNAVGRHFFNMPYEKADRINGMGNSQFISDLMPKFPIYTNLLPETARKVIGKPNKDAVGAIKLLEAEGFRYRGTVDIFDAGPCVHTVRDQIKTVRTASQMQIANITHIEDDTAYLVANPQTGGFQAVIANLDINNAGALTLSPDATKILGVGIGDEVLFVPFKG